MALRSRVRTDRSSAGRRVETFRRQRGSPRQAFSCETRPPAVRTCCTYRNDATRRTHCTWFPTVYPCGVRPLPPCGSGRMILLDGNDWVETEIAKARVFPRDSVTRSPYLVHFTQRCDAPHILHSASHCTHVRRPRTPRREYGLVCYDFENLVI